MDAPHPWIGPEVDGTFTCTFPSERTDAETFAFWDALEALFDSGEAPPRFAVILDLRRIRASSHAARARMADHLKRYDAFHTRHCVGLAVVVGSRIARAAVAALTWMIPHRAAPMKVFDALPEAQAWIGELWRSEPIAARPTEAPPADLSG